jgi:hypothetical protein
VNKQYYSERKLAENGKGSGEGSWYVDDKKAMEEAGWGK